MEMTAYTKISNNREDLLNDIFELLIKTSDRPTHFKLVPAIDSVLFHLIPQENLSNYHLNSFCIHFYEEQNEVSTKSWWGEKTRGFKPNVLYPLHSILNTQ